MAHVQLPRRFTTRSTDNLIIHCKRACRRTTLAGNAIATAILLRMSMSPLVGGTRTATHERTVQTCRKTRTLLPFTDQRAVVILHCTVGRSPEARDDDDCAAHKGVINQSVDGGDRLFRSVGSCMGAVLRFQRFDPVVPWGATYYGAGRARRDTDL